MTLLGRTGQLQLAHTSHLHSCDGFDYGREVSPEEVFRQHIASYLKLVRKRQDLYCRVSKLPDVQHCQLDSLLEEVALLTRKITEARHIQSSLSSVDRKTLAYHLCAKFVELLEGLKNKLSSSGFEHHIEGNKQEVLRRYRSMVDSGEFDATELVQVMSDFRRKLNRLPTSYQESNMDYRGRSQSTNTTPAMVAPVTESSRNRFLLSTQILSSKQKQHLVQFMQGKQRARQRKAKIEEQSKVELRSIRQAFKSLYGPLQTDEIFHNQYCLTLSKEENMASLLAKQLERNSRISENLNNYNETHKAHKLRISRFRIRRQPVSSSPSVPLCSHEGANERSVQQ